MKKVITALAAVLLLAHAVEAGCRHGGGRGFRRHRACGSYQSHVYQSRSFSSYQGCPTCPQTAAPAGPAPIKPPQPDCPDGKCPATPKGDAAGAGNPHDALAAVNSYRVSRGLRPFRRCPGLTAAATQCVIYRERYRIVGHAPNDFAFLPPGYVASATGAEGPGWPVGSGWGTCCMDDNYEYAGAAWVAGSDGHQYMSLFVRN